VVFRGEQALPIGFLRFACVVQERGLAFYRFEGWRVNNEAGFDFRDLELECCRKE
jgi:hypothetical protein